MRRAHTGPVAYLSALPLASLLLLAAVLVVCVALGLWAAKDHGSSTSNSKSNE